MACQGAPVSKGVASRAHLGDGQAGAQALAEHAHALVLEVVEAGSAAHGQGLYAPLLAHLHAARILWEYSTAFRFRFRHFFFENLEECCCLIRPHRVVIQCARLCSGADYTAKEMS